MSELSLYTRAELEILLSEARMKHKIHQAALRDERDAAVACLKGIMVGICNKDPELVTTATQAGARLLAQLQSPPPTMRSLDELMMGLPAFYINEDGSMSPEGECNE